MRLSRLILQRRIWNKVVSLVLIGSMLPGCSGPDKKITYLGSQSDELDQQNEVMAIEHPEVDEPTPDVVAATQKPRRIGDRSRDELWDVSLAEIIHMALMNNKIIRVRSDYRTAGSAIFNNTDGIPSVYDPALRDSGVLFGGKGVEAALSAFDPIFQANMLWGSNAAIQNNPFFAGGLAGGGALKTDTGTFTTGITKNFAYGAQASIANNTNYQQSNAPAQLFPSVYTGNVQAQYIQPLLAGAGTEYTRIAGPATTSLNGVSGVNQGVIISRISADLVINDVELAVRNMLRDVEETYWDLYLAYRSYDTAVEARNSFLRSWRFAQANKGVGKFSELDELQSRQAFFSGREAVENALQNLYLLETQLRRLCGLPSADGKVIRPKDDPATGEYIPDWNLCLAESLTRREELRRQKWNIKSLELQLLAAKNLVNPSLNFVASYQLNGFGNNLFNINNVNTPGPGGANLQSYFQTLTAANQTGYTVGFTFNMPLGFRLTLAQVRNYELRLAKAKEALANQEREICHELTTTFQNMAWRFQTAQTNYNRWQVAEAQVPGRENRYRTGVPGIDTSVLLQQWLTTRTDAATAEVNFYTSVVEYQKAITDLHFRKGTLLELDNVHLSESTWTPEAYADAFRRALARSYAFDAASIDPVHTEPEEFVREGWIGQVDMIGTAPPAANGAETDGPAGMHSKSGPLKFAPPPESPDSLPPEAPVPDEAMED
jgi:outer membrane protein TolC